MVYAGPSQGCDQCRTRRVGCTLEQPVCRKCQQLGLTCSGPRLRSTETFHDETAMVVQRHSLATRSRPYRSNEARLRRSGARTQLASGTEAIARNRQIEEGVQRHSIVPRPPSSGGYDPFGAFVFRVDMTVNEILTFWKTYMMKPLQQSDDSVASSLASDGLAYICDGFRNAHQGYAFLAVATSAYSSTQYSIEKTILATRCRNLSIARLRSFIESGTIGPELVCGVSTSLIAEVAAHNFSAARVHLEFLRRTLYPTGTLAVPLRAGARHAFFWSDIQTAVATFVQPVMCSRGSDFDSMLSFDIWLQLPQSQEIQDAISNRLLALDRDALDIPAALHQLLAQLVTCEVLLPILWDSNCTLDIIETIQLFTALLFLTGQLLTLATATVRNIESRADITDPERSSAYLTAAACLAGVYWLRYVTREEVSNCGDNRSEFMDNAWILGPAILTKMVGLLKAHTSDASILSAGSQSYSKRLHLWVLQVGTYMKRYMLEDSLHESYCQRALIDLLRFYDMAEEDSEYERLLDGFPTLNSQTTIAPLWFRSVYRTFGMLMH